MSRRERFSVDLSDRTGVPVHVTLTRNRRRLVSVHRRRGAIDVRVHEALVGAPRPVRDALARFVAEGCQDSALVIRTHLRQRIAEGAPPVERVRLTSRGDHHDLGAIMLRVARRLPGRHVLPLITWGPKRRPGRYTVRLGTYDPERRLIRIHPVLDHPEVPPSVMRHVVYHELLHHVLGVDDHPHGPRFADMERRCPDYLAAADWIRSDLPRRVSSARRGNA